MTKIKYSFFIFFLFIVIYGYNNPLFCYVKQIDIKGNKMISRIEIIQTSNIQNKLLFFYNEKQYINNIKENLFINSVSLKKISYSKIQLDIQERIFIFNVNSNKFKGLLDEDGIFFKSNYERLKNDLPILNTELKSEFRKALMIDKLFRESELYQFFNLSELIIDEIIGIQIYTNLGQTILLGESDIKKKIRQLKFIMQDSLANEKKPIFIDLRENGKAIVNYNL